MPAAAHAPILTVTPNPALDVSTAVDRVIPEHKLRCGPTRLDPGGGGINVARVVRGLGGRAIALYAAGGPTGRAYRDLLEREGVVAQVVRVSGSTRESLTVDETSTGRQFRFVLQGPHLAEPEWRALLSAVADGLPLGGLVVGSGSLPPGVPADFYARIARMAREHGVRCVVDASGEALRAALDERVHLIKPSKRELGELVGSELGGEAELVAAARELVDRGACDIVALTLGGAGAVLVTAEGALRLPSPPVRVISTVGAGDGFLGGFVLRLAQGRAPADAFRTAVAAGAATAALPATELADAEAVAALEPGLEPVAL